MQCLQRGCVVQKEHFEISRCLEETRHWKGKVKEILVKRANYGPGLKSSIREKRSLSQSQLQSAAVHCNKIVFKQEIENIKKELSSQKRETTRDVSVIFDGSTRQGEAIAIIVRFVDDDWVMTQCLMRIDICSKSVNSEELARVLNEALCMEYGIRASPLLAAMRNGASVNQAAH